MQYLLTEDEMAEVERRQELMRAMPPPEAIAALARKMACHMVDLMPPNCGKVIDVPHGCIHVDDERARQPGYCDRCPASVICQLPKRWSK